MQGHPATALGALPRWSPGAFLGHCLQAALQKALHANPGLSGALGGALEVALMAVTALLPCGQGRATGPEVVQEDPDAVELGLLGVGVPPPAMSVPSPASTKCEKKSSHHTILSHLRVIHVI